MGSNLEDFLVEVASPKKTLHFCYGSCLFLCLMSSFVLVLAFCLPFPVSISLLQIPSSAQFP